MQERILRHKKKKQSKIRRTKHTLVRLCKEENANMFTINYIAMMILAVVLPNQMYLSNNVIYYVSKWGKETVLKMKSKLKSKQFPKNQM